MLRRWCALVFISFAGCFQTTGDDADLRTVPVTNNPHIVPSHGGGLPGMGGASQGPY